MISRIKNFIYTNPELCAGIVIFLYSLIEYFYQPVNTNQEGKGWDGYNHYLMAQDLDFKAIQDPFKYRVFSASFVHFMHHLPLFTNNIIDNYRIFNLIFSVLFVFFAFKILRILFKDEKYIPAIFFTWFLLITTELSPIRTVFFMPINSDIVHETMILMVTYFFLKIRLTEGQNFMDNWKSYLGVLLCFLIGGTNRENFYTTIALFSFVCLYYDNQSSLFVSFRLDKKTLYSFLAMISGVALAMMIVTAFLGNFGSADKTQAILTYLFLYKTVKMVIALINTYGVYFLCMLNTRKAEVDLDKGIFYSCKIAIFVTIAVSMIGGSDTERYIYWNIPFIVILAFPYVQALFENHRYIRILTTAIFTVIHHKLLFPVYESGRGIHNDFHAYYSLEQVLTGKGPIIYNWSGFSHPLMKVKMLMMYGGTAAFIILQDLLLSLKMGVQKFTTK